MIAFEPAEAVRCLPFLKQGGTVVVNQKAVKPVTASLSGLAYTGAEMLEYLQSAGIRTILIDGDAVCAACQSPKVLNIALLAAAANTDALGISVAQLKDAVQQLVPEKFHALNLGAIEYVCNR